MLARVYRVYRAAGDRGTAVTCPDTNVVVCGEGGATVTRLELWHGSCIQGRRLDWIGGEAPWGRAPQNWLGEWDDF